MKNLKKILLTTAILALLSNTIIANQINNPYLDLTNETGQSVSFDKIIDSNNKTIVVFWNTYNRLHIDYLDHLNDYKQDIASDTDLRIIAISSDKYHSHQQLISMAAGNGWEFDIYVDVNETFMRKNALNDNLHTIVLDNNELLNDADLMPRIEGEIYRFSSKEFLPVF